MYGGQDAAGNYLQDLWLLRAYNGRVASSEEWAGYANGELQSGVNANGAGVKVEFITGCASPRPSQSGSPTSPTNPSSSDTNVDVPPPPPSAQYTTSISHKILSPISVILLFPAIFCFRLAFPSSSSSRNAISPLYMFILFTVSSYALAIAGLTLAFTSRSSVGLSRRDEQQTTTHLQTTHSRAALAFFILTYAITPVLAAILICGRRTRRRVHATREDRRNSLVLEKKTSVDVTTGPHSESECGPSRALSVGPSSVATHGHLAHAEDMEPASAPTTPTPLSTLPRSFAVVNRPKQQRARSANSWLAVRAAEISSDGHRSPGSSNQGHLRSLSDVDWMMRRRSLNAVVGFQKKLCLCAPV